MAKLSLIVSSRYVHLEVSMLPACGRTFDSSINGVTLLIKEVTRRIAISKSEFCGALSPLKWINLIVPGYNEEPLFSKKILSRIDWSLAGYNTNECFSHDNKNSNKIISLNYVGEKLNAKCKLLSSILKTYIVFMSEVETDMSNMCQICIIE